MFKKKHVLTIVGIACVWAVSLSVVYVAASPAWTIDDLVSYMENVGRHKIWQTNWILYNEIKPTVDDIEAKLDGWFDTGGKYSKTTQIVSGGKRHEFTATGDHYVYDPGVEMNYKITITISTRDMDAGEVLQLWYGVGGAGAMHYQYVTIATGANIYPAVTYEFCGYSRPNWRQVQLRATSVVDGFTVWYSYVVTYEP